MIRGAIPPGRLPQEVELSVKHALLWLKYMHVPGTLALY